MTGITPELLDALLSPAAEQRNAAESFLNQLTVEQRCEGFFNILQQQQNNPQHVMMASILLRRAILLISDQSQLVALAEPLLGVFGSIPNNKKFIGDCLAEITASLQWMDVQASTVVLQKITQAIGNSVSQGEIESIQLLIRAAQRADKSFASVVAPILPNIAGQAFSSIQSDPNKVALLLELVVVAAGACQEESFGVSCILPLMKFFQQQPTGGAYMTSVLETLLLAADETPAVLSASADVFTATIQLCLQTVQQSSNDCRRQLNAIQVVCTLTSVETIKRGLVMNPVQLAELLQTNSESSVVRSCLQAMCTETDDDLEAWTADPATLNEDGTGWDGDEDAVYAEELLEQLIFNFGAAAVHVILPAIEQSLTSSNDDWKTQRAALSALQCCAEAAPVSFAPFVSTAMEAAMKFASASSHPRIQYQAIMLLGVLCETIAYETPIRSAAAGRLLETLARASHSSCSKVAAMACLAIVSYCRPAGKELADPETWVVPFVSDVLGALVAGPLSADLNNSGTVVVKARAIGAVACLAESTGDYFAQFYASVMPGLLSCAQLSTGGNHEMMHLTGAALETATIIGQAIKEEHADMFMGDAKTILQWAVPVLQNENATSSNVPMDQLLAACARIASVMEEEYAQYAEIVLPHLLKRATAPDDVEFSEGNLADLDSARKQQAGIDEDNGTESMTVAIPGRGLTKVTINTTKIQEKAQAARSIYEHAVALGASFGPFSKQCLDAFLPLASFKFSPVIRTTASQTLAAVFEASCNFGENSANMEIPKQYFPLVMNAISKQVEDEDPSDMETLLALAEAVCDVCRTVYFLDEDNKPPMRSQLAFEDVRFVVQRCMKSMTTCLHRRTKIADTIARGSFTGEDEREEYESLLRKEQELLTPLVDTVGYLLKLLKQDFVSIFESEVAPVLGSYLQNGNDIRARHSAVCLFDDIVEHCGSAAAERFAPQLIGGAMLGLDSATNGQDDDMRSASIYGISQMARYAPSSVLAPHAQTIVQQLGVLTSMRKEEASNSVVYENAVSCLASLLLIGNAPFASSGYMKRDIVMKTFLSSLPLREDPDEARICHEGLCDLIEGGLVNVISECDNLVRIDGETLAFVEDGEQIAAPDTCARFAGIFMRLQQEASQDTIQNSYNSLSSQGQAAINEVIGQYAGRYANIVSP